MKLLEDARDAAALEAFAQALAAGSEETIPAEVAEAILDGRNPVRVLRAWLGFTLKQMGEACGATDAHISQIETGKRSMSVATLTKLAASLGVDVELLLQAARQEETGKGRPGFTGPAAWLAEWEGGLLGLGARGGLDHRAGAQAAGANGHGADLAGGLHGAHFAQVGLEAALALVVGVGDVVAHLGLLAALFANLGHIKPPTGRAPRNEILVEREAMLTRAFSSWQAFC
jgi:DNA-binding XRE family transcriptional regulator